MSDQKRKEEIKQTAEKIRQRVEKEGLVLVCEFHKEVSGWTSLKDIFTLAVLVSPNQSIYQALIIICKAYNFDPIENQQKIIAFIKHIDFKDRITAMNLAIFEDLVGIPNGTYYCLFRDD